MKSEKIDSIPNLKIKLLNEVAAHLDEPNCQCKLVDILKNVGSGPDSPKAKSNSPNNNPNPGSGNC